MSAAVVLLKSASCPVGHTFSDAIPLADHGLQGARIRVVLDVTGRQDSACNVTMQVSQNAVSFEDRTNIVLNDGSRAVLDCSLPHGASHARLKVKTWLGRPIVSATLRRDELLNAA